MFFRPALTNIMVLGVILLFSSCLTEQEEFTFDPSASLRFSTDTVMFDTVFTSVGSVTKRFRVYNDAEKAVNIEQIQLSGGTSSSYQIAVNGVFGTEFNDITLLGQDSLLVLVDVTIDPADENNPFLVSDSLIFTTNGNRQAVTLVSYGQDAIFLNGEVIECNTTWTADRPYVLSNSILIDTLCQLTIEAGTRIYSQLNSNIFVRGTFVVNGTAEEPVIFRNDRLEERFNNAPGQWGGIIFLPGSHSNAMEFTSIRNAKTGIYLGTPDDDDLPDLVLGHCIIENMGGAEGVPAGNFTVEPGYGILAVTSDLYVYNTLINNCAINTVGNYGGGNYRYEHCTLASFSFDFFRQQPSVVLSNNVALSDNSVIRAPLDVVILNSIIWGSLPDELLINEDPAVSFEVEIRSNLIRSLTYSDQYPDNLWNNDPRFLDPRMHDYHLDTLSPAKDAGIQLGFETDLEGNSRDIFPDLGAYERDEL
jgi:hypothetical protein